MSIPWITCETCGFRWFAVPPGSCPSCHLTPYLIPAKRVRRQIADVRREWARNQ